MTIDEEMLMAFADGELQGSDREAVEQALANDADLRERLEAQRRLREALTGHYGPVASEDVPDRLLAMLGASPAENVASLNQLRERRRALLRPAWRNFGAIAATLAVGILAGQLMPSRTSGPITYQDGRLVAEGDLATALKTQLASAQAPGAIRIGVTFAKRDGGICRTFDRAATSGLACEDGGKWTVLTTSTHAAQTTQYRQAGSSPVMQAAQDMMAGAPFDADQERAAMKAGWKISRTGQD